MTEEATTKTPRDESALSGRSISMGFADFAAACYNGEDPPCRAACPIDLDIKDFITKIQRKNFNSAYTILRDTVIFPEIVCEICPQPCASACVRRDVDGHIDMKKLERAAIAHARSTDAVKYNIPKKSETIAIVGGGLTGLSATVRLVSHGYSVELFEASGRLGGRLWTAMPDGRFVKEIERRMAATEYVLNLNSPVEDINDLVGRFDAVLVATGENGRDFGLLANMNRESLGSALNGVFLAGGLLGSPSMEAIENAMRAVQSLESYVKTGRMHEMLQVKIRSCSRLRINTERFEASPRVHADSYTLDDAIQEAKNCYKCDCEECRVHCDYMQQFKILPEKMVLDVRACFNLVEGLGQRTGTRLISSCNICGLCGEICTENIDMGSLMLEARRILHREESVSPVFHDYWLREMWHAQGDRAFLARNAPGAEKSEWLFFPGCQLAASDQDYVVETYRLLLGKQPATGLLLGCCGIPAEWAGDEKSMTRVVATIRGSWEAMGRPTTLVACPSCEKMFRKYLPEIAVRSLYGVVHDLGIAREGTDGGTVSVFDPCSSRYDPDMQASVRNIVRDAGFTVEELPVRGSKAACCGYGGHVYIAKPELPGKMAERRIALSDNPYITYCTNCRDIFAAKGKPTRHILDVVLGKTDENRPAPSLSDRRRNREHAKERLLKEIWTEETSMAEKPKYEVRMAEDIVRKMNELLILEDDLRQTIDYLESTGAKLQDAKTGHFIGHRKLGHMTYWVEYTFDGDVCTVHNAYNHRMHIEGE